MTQHLWYVRDKKGVVSGPFPSLQIRQAFSLGEFDLRDQVSLDGEQWISLFDSGLLAPEHVKSGSTDDEAWRKEREEARRRWLDDSVEARSDADPVTLPGTEVNMRLRRHEEEIRSLLEEQSRRRPAFVAGLTSLLVLLLVGIGVWIGQAGEQGIQASLAGRVRNCQVSPGEAVNWSGCNKDDGQFRGVNLKNAILTKARFERADLSAAELSYATLDGADLRGANLRNAKMRGASLLRADLTGADLSGADLGFAILNQAVLDGARLTGASFSRSTWVDGRVCAEASMGSCQ